MVTVVCDDAPGLFSSPSSTCSGPGPLAAGWCQVIQSAMQTLHIILLHILSEQMSGFLKVRHSLQNLQTHQHIDRNVGARWILPAKHRKTIFVNTAENLVIECGSPGLFKSSTESWRRLGRRCRVPNPSSAEMLAWGRAWLTLRQARVQLGMRHSWCGQYG